MLQSRLAFRTLAKKSDELTIAIVPAGTSFPPLGRISVFSLLVLLRPVELGPVDPHAMQNDRELTSGPLPWPCGTRCAWRLCPQAFTDHFGTRVSRTPAASVKRAPSRITAFHRATKRAFKAADFRPSWHRHGYPTNLSHG